MSRPLILSGGDLAQLSDTDVLQLPDRAITPGDTTPDPGIDGVIVNSSTANVLIRWNEADGVWEEVSGSGGGDGADEVWIGDSPPPDPDAELWIDTDEDPPAEPGIAPVLIIMEGDTVPPETEVGTIVIVVPVG